MYKTDRSCTRNSQPPHFYRAELDKMRGRVETATHRQR
jgi:hypothetical protein